jgi:prostamide/prostaglandin F2alpha synthase
MGVELVALGHEMLGVGEFYTGGYWQGALYIDKKKEVFAQLGTNQGNLLGLLSRQTLDAGKAATERGTEGNLEGDGFQLGGVWVFDAAGVCTYSYKSDSFGDHPKPKLVLEEATKAAARST